MAQRALWPELAAVPGQYVLYRGTGLALRLGHRESIDPPFVRCPPMNGQVGRRPDVFGTSGA